jgi:hypothetical protein
MKRGPTRRHQVYYSMQRTILFISSHTDLRLGGAWGEYPTYRNRTTDLTTLSLEGCRVQLPSGFGLCSRKKIERWMDQCRLDSSYGNCRFKDVEILTRWVRKGSCECGAARGEIQGLKKKKGGSTTVAFRGRQVLCKQEQN